MLDHFWITFVFSDVPKSSVILLGCAQLGSCYCLLYILPLHLVHGITAEPLLLFKTICCNLLLFLLLFVYSPSEVFRSYDNYFIESNLTLFLSKNFTLAISDCHAGKAVLWYLPNVEKAHMGDSCRGTATKTWNYIVWLVMVFSHVMFHNEKKK